MSNPKTTSNDQPAVAWALLAVRIFIGIIFMAHGAQKLFGAFGGGGLAQTVAHMGPIGYLVAIGEFFGGLGILVGVLPRFSAAANIVIMLGAIFTVHGKNGFFTQQGGFEYPFSLIGLLLPILILGAGSFSFSEKFKISDLTGRKTASA